MPSFTAPLSPRGRLGLALVACLLCAPALPVGLLLDDYLLAIRLRAVDGSVRWAGLLDAFSFVRPGELARLRELGAMPWWSSSDLTLNFLRPLTALTHAVDFWLFPHALWLMHLESIVLLLAVNLTVYKWYARLFADSPRTSTLAYVLFTLSPGHAFAAGWLANRNALLATLFALLSLLAHDRARERPRLGMRALSLGALLLSLLSGEMGTATLGLLVAHALCLDNGTVRERLRVVLPALLLGLVWLLSYRLLGYGTAGSSLYVDPAHDPVAYLRQLPVHLPILLFGQWLLPVVSGTLMLSRAATLTFAGLALLSLAVIAPCVLDVLRRDARARFSGLAALLALLPVAATKPHDRLLLAADIGGLALVALTVEACRTHAVWRARLLSTLVQIRIWASLVLGTLYVASLAQQSELSERPFDHALHDDALTRQSLIFVNPPCVYFAAHLALLRAVDGGPIPHRIRGLAPGIYPLEVRRLDARTLAIRSKRGLLQPPGNWRSEGTDRPGPASAVYAAQVLNQFARDERPFQRGERIALSDVSVEVAAVTADGFPSEVHARFIHPLEHPSLRFVMWRDGKVVPFVVPKLGEHVTLAPILR